MDEETPLVSAVGVDCLGVKKSAFTKKKSVVICVICVFLWIMICVWGMSLLSKLGNILAVAKTDFPTQNKASPLILLPSPPLVPHTIHSTTSLNWGVVGSSRSL